MNNAINQRFVVALYTAQDGGHCDSEFLAKRQEAVDYAKSWIRKSFEKHKEILYAEITNYMQPGKEPIRINLFEVGDRIYVWDQYKSLIPNHGQVGGSKYQGGRAYGNIISIEGSTSGIQI